MAALRLLAVGAVVAIAAGGTGSANVPGCGRPVAGGSAPERAAVKRMLCLMPGTVIERVEISRQPPDAPADSVWLALTIPASTRNAHSVSWSRAHWEVDVAAGAIRDGFDRLGLSRVVAYEALASDELPDSSRLVGIALRRWEIRRWATGARPTSLGRGVGTWAQLQAKLDVLSLRFGVKTRLERFNAFGKAPVVTVTAKDGGRFIDAGGFTAYSKALQFGAARYDGVLLQLFTPTGEQLQLFTISRGRAGSGCAGYGRIPHRRYEICPSD